MADRMLPLNRRELLAGLGAAALGSPSMAAAKGRPSLTLQAETGASALRPGEADTPIWSLQAQTSDRVKRGDQLEITFQNDLPIPTLLNWRGIDGVPAAEPLAARSPLRSGAMETFMVPMRHAGTFMADLRMLGDGQLRPSPARALVVQENEPVGVDGDEVFLIEDWRLRADGAAIAPGIDPRDTTPIYTVNGQLTLDISARRNERLRLRFINGFQRNVIAIKIEQYDVRVMALDGQPAEPFLARDGIVVLAPGTRADTFVDTTGAAGIDLIHTPARWHRGSPHRPAGRLERAADPARAAAGGASAAIQWPAWPDRPQERFAL